MIDDAHHDAGPDKLRRTPDPDALAPSETHPIGPIAEPETSPWNLPNALTAFRIVLVPIFAWMLLSHPEQPWWRFCTAVIFSVAILTDTLDGYLARKHNIITRFGKLADPIADKALTGMAFIGLSIIDELPWWVTITILVREWGITIMRFVVLRYGVMAAGRGGKVKTVTQAIAVILYLLPLPGPAHVVAMIVMAVAWLITMATGLDYIRGGAPPAASRPRPVKASALAASILAELRRRGQTLASAESLTGGMVGALLTDIPGASANYLGGVISYATPLKATLAGVDRTTLAELGPVAERTAAEMARGVAERCNADWGLATTGVAGPEPQNGHHVGQVFVAVSHPATSGVARRGAPPARRSRNDPATGCLSCAGIAG